MLLEYVFIGTRLSFSVSHDQKISWKHNDHNLGADNPSGLARPEHGFIWIFLFYIIICYYAVPVLPGEEWQKIFLFYFFHWHYNALFVHFCIVCCEGLTKRV